MLFQKMSGKRTTTSMVSPGAPFQLWSWGKNNNGQLGIGVIGASYGRSSPIQVGALTNWQSVSAGRFESLAIKTDGTLWAWGKNHYGQLGLNDVAYRSSPVQVGALATWSKIVSKYRISFALKTDGTLWAWGRGGGGFLGLGDTVGRSSPVQVGTLATWSAISDGYAQSFAIKTDGTLWTWGMNTKGQLGIGNVVDKSSPVQVGTLTAWRTLSCGLNHTLAIKTDGTLWAWGYNGSGRLGLGDYTHYVGYPVYGQVKWDRSSPVQVGILTTWSTVSAGSTFSAAIKTDGTLWTWGSNGSEGYLGLGDTIKRSVPVQVGTLATWSQIGTGNRHSLAMKTNGTLWGWGHNVYGQLGLGNATSVSSPVQVGTLTSWVVIAKGSEAHHSLGLRT